MQSDSPAGPAASASAWPAWPAHPGFVALVAAVPAIGFAAEFLTGALSTMLSLFPTWWHAVFVALAVAANLALHLGAWRTARQLPARAAATGFVAGMALLYAFVEAPALPAMVFLSWTGLGILAAAPYFVCLGLWRLLPDLAACWRAAGRPLGQLAALFAMLVLLPAGVTGWAAWQHGALRRDFATLADAMRDDARAEEAERLAGRLRQADLDQQRALCVDGWSDDDEPPFAFFRGADGGRPLAHIATGRPFWFVHPGLPGRRAARKLPLATARLAFHRAHGFGWNDGDPAVPAVGWEGGARIEWLASRVTVRPEPEAALAQVDWELEVTSDRERPDEARFDLRLPPGAFASSLSLWIGGEERPAAFAAQATVKAAYDAVVSKARDPALLQELSPGLLRLLLFPLSRHVPPMRVRLGFTVPLRCRGTTAELYLPQVADHTCRAGRVARHELVCEDTALPVVRLVDDEELARPIVMRGGAPLAVARDADGLLVQRLVPRPARALPVPAVVVLDASASVGQVLADPAALFAAFPPGTACVVFAAHGNGFARFAAPVGSSELTGFLRAQPFTGGVDARPALAAAAAEAARHGVPRLYWLHGAAPVLHALPWPTFVAGAELAALAVHPGRNLLREQLPAAAGLVDVPRFGVGEAQLADGLAEFVRCGGPGAALDIGDHERLYERAATAPPGAVPVSDQVARLWAARRARDEARAGRGEAAARLAARYRVVTAGVGAVVLEAKAQYDAYGLDPGAEIGREPAGPIGGGPVPEPSTWLLLATGLVVVGSWHRRRTRPIRRPATPAA